MKTWIDKLEKVGACREALKWAKDYDSLEDAWQKCGRGDWMLWLAGKLSGNPDSKSRKKVVLAACQCARLALKYVKPGELRPLKAIETAEAWANGNPEVSLQDVRKAAAAADYAAAAAAADYAAAAAAYAAAAAAAAYADAAYAAAAYAAAADAAYAARIKTLKECADIVRKYYPEPPKGGK
jgi:hypothetical protein